MANRDEPELLQGPADCSKTTAPAVAESSSTLEDSAPMLDVHAPHQTVHTWKDFLIHISAIAIGLLLALALEKLVEYIHERHQLTDARRELAMEVADNRRTWAINVIETSRIRQELDADLKIIQAVRAHARTALAGGPAERFAKPDAPSGDADLCVVSRNPLVSHGVNART